VTDREYTESAHLVDPAERDEPLPRLPAGVSAEEAARQYDALRVRHEALRRKYRSLCGKYGALFDRWQEMIRRRNGPGLLALQALGASSMAIAMLRGDAFAARNASWRTLDEAGAEWRLIPEGSAARARSYPSLRALALGESGAMLRAGDLVREERFEREDGLAIDVRLERIATGPTHPLVMVAARDATERVARERARDEAWHVLFSKGGRPTLEGEDGPFAAIEPAPV
jgi:hypothetical protein